MERKLKNGKLICFVALAGMLMACNGKKNADETCYSQQMVERRALKTFLSNKREQQLATAQWDYVPGLVAGSVLKAWEQYPEKEEYYNVVKAYADFCLQGGDTVHVNDNNLDDLAAGKMFFALYQHELERGNTADAERYKHCAAYLRDKLKYNHTRIAEGKPGAGCLVHKQRYPDQMWLDGMYMGIAFYAAWQHHFGGELGEADCTESWTDIARQFKTLHRYTYDRDKKLNYHVWAVDPDEPNAFWAQREGGYRGCSPEFWGRGMGWYFAALVDVLELMPETHADYPDLLRITREVAEGLALYQDPASGCWYQLLQYGEDKRADGKGDYLDGRYYNVGDLPNYLESSASGMFAYAYLKGIRLGFLSADRYMPVAKKAYEGLLAQFIRENANGELDIIQSCASAGLGPRTDISRSGTVNYYLCGYDVSITQNEGKAIGPFIMASLEWELLR